jgi:alkaline phosphatase
MMAQRSIGHLIDASLISLCTSLSIAGVPAKVVPARNIIIMIPDGMSVGGTTLARWLNGGDKPLAMDDLAAGLIRTYPADAIVNDSAPAGTAYACGITAQTGNVGVYPDAMNMPGLGQPKPDGINNLSPAANIMEAARSQGRSTGLIATCEIQHATPADFAAHEPSRKNYDNIGEQEVYAGFDVVLGGGRKFFAPENRKDKEDLVSVIKSNYAYVQDLPALKACQAARIWGAFAPTDMGYDLDRDPSLVPSLAEMTEKAISTLSRNKQGFVLMVEGSLIDWAAHDNDVAGIAGDIAAFDKAVAVAMDFARKDQDTVVLVMTDHGNSGITIGNAATTSNYDKLPLKTVVGPLKKATRTAQGVADLINAERSNIPDVAAKYYGVTLDPEEVAKIRSAKDSAQLRTLCTAVLSPKLAAEARIGFTTGGHTGEDVVLYAYDPHGTRPTGVIMNTDVARYMEKLLGADLAALTGTRFQKAAIQFAQKGASARTDFSDTENPVLVVRKGASEIRFFRNKNLALIDGKEARLSGLVLYTGLAGGENWYVPEDAVALVK